ncbi:hypothetical protein PPROV_000679400 [Pycnococcus provasolii]|uniref:leucine--tRNA ligase n=1 Tax=Pycnococcus provasolii TaxID=41880 RepID=A0A830HME9_9CHLO|nr:hypothetical protein PPROV_000679400 [Pycnococcus provasolii]
MGKQGNAAEEKGASTGEENTARRDQLLEIQTYAQSKWAQEKIFESNAPTNATAKPAQAEKFFGNFPYPYMNGTLHLGHAFSLSKLEFASAYHRLCGKNVLFPQGFHCTGMPIKACADRLRNEMQQYGCPPVFPSEEEEEAAAAAKEAEAAAQGSTPADPTKFKAKKSKAAAKKGKGAYQWQILQSSGIPDSEIPKFADANYWLHYFPPLAKRDISAMGCGVDWRRSFITTPVNPYYDKFVRWQMNKLRAMGKIVKDKRFAVYSPLDGQPCADHDRATGEGVGPQEYVLVKMKLLEFPGKLAPLAGKKVFLAAATLRPETMYGQTNCWVLPDGDYGAFEMKNGDIFVIAARAARNLAYQEQTKEFGVVDKIMDLKGTDLLGLPLKAPRALYEKVYTLPMLSISMDKGTGVVTSVPSDSPDDFCSLRDLKEKPAFREKYGIKDEMIMPFEVIPIINIPEFGDTSAIKVCEELKIKSANDKDKLAIAKDRTYLKGFTEGVMLVGAHKGKKVSDAKPIIKGEMIAEGDGILYSEPEKKVMSRSGDECIVALTDQWYITYGEEKWREVTEKLLANMETYHSEARNSFEYTLGWMKQWACSRNFGLGSRLPWDEDVLVESLSDSTIYMAYYTVAHLLHAGHLYDCEGSKLVDPNLCGDKFWDYVFLGEGDPKAIGISMDLLAKMRAEFNYWYPFDLRVSGKDLIQNHLTFSLYNHTAIFPLSECPRSFRTNGHLLLNGEKMSKNTGNFLTLRQAIDKYSSDAMRLTLADASDGLDDANFGEETANAIILRLTREITWIEETLAAANKGAFREGEMTFYDRWFVSAVSKRILDGKANFDAMLFREAVKDVFFGMILARDEYRLVSGGTPMHRDALMYYIDAWTRSITPFAPHFSEHVWSRMLKRGSTVTSSGYPEARAIDNGLLLGFDYVKAKVIEWRKDIAKREKKAKGPQDKVKAILLQVSPEFKGWRKTALDVLKSHFDASTRSFPEKIMDLAVEHLRATCFPEQVANQVKAKVGSFVKFRSDMARNVGEAALASKLLFSELEMLRANEAYLCSALKMDAIVIISYAGDAEEVCPESPKVDMFVGPKAAEAARTESQLAANLPSAPVPATLRVASANSGDAASDAVHMFLAGCAESVRSKVALDASGGPVSVVPSSGPAIASVVAALRYAAAVERHTLYTAARAASQGAMTSDLVAVSKQLCDADAFEGELLDAIVASGALSRSADAASLDSLRELMPAPLPAYGAKGVVDKVGVGGCLLACVLDALAKRKVALVEPFAAFHANVTKQSQFTSKGKGGAAAPAPAAAKGGKGGDKAAGGKGGKGGGGGDSGKKGPPSAEEIAARQAAKQAEIEKKLIKDVTKEGGKKGVEIEGAADMGGLEFFCTTMEKPDGEVKYLKMSMDAMNEVPDPDGEERRGGSGHVGKMIFSAGTEAMSMVAYVPKDKQDRINATEWLKSVCGDAGVKGELQAGGDAGLATAVAKANPDAGMFTIKMKDAAMAHGFSYLRERGCFPEDTGDDDDDDGEYVYGDDDFPS